MGRPYGLVLFPLIVNSFFPLAGDGLRTDTYSNNL